MNLQYILTDRCFHNQLHLILQQVLNIQNLNDMYLETLIQTQKRDTFYDVVNSNDLLYKYLFLFQNHYLHQHRCDKQTNENNKQNIGILTLSEHDVVQYYHQDDCTSDKLNENSLQIEF